MKITNKTNLPQVVVNAVEEFVYPPNSDNSVIRVTALIQPPIVWQLKKRHWNELEEDVADNAWRLLGTGVHLALEKGSKNHITERRIKKEIDGVILTGMVDVVDGCCIYDYKCTSVWHKVFADGLPKEWVQQLNIYAYLLGNITSAKIIVIYRDWSKSKINGDDYPPAPIMAYDVKLAVKEEQEIFIKQRIAIHKAATEMTDNELLLCSPDERWQTETKYAVYKNKNKTATRVFCDKQKAEKFIEGISKQYSKDNFRLEERKGADKKCENFCPVKAYCRHGKTLENKEK